MTRHSGPPLTALTAWIAGFSAIAVTLAGCGGSHGSGPTTPPNTPHVSNLAVATSPQGCPVQGLAGKVRTVTLDFVDADGDERGGHVDLSLSATGGPVQSVSGAIPSNFVSINGTTSGTITVSVCIAVTGGTATLDASLTDSAGNTSNTLSASVSALQPMLEQSGSPDAAKERPAIGLSPR